MNSLMVLFLKYGEINRTNILCRVKNILTGGGGGGGGGGMAMTQAHELHYLIREDCNVAFALN